MGSGITNTRIKIEQIEITHASHPLRGKKFDVIHEEKKRSGARIRIQVRDDDQRVIPIEWTDAYPSVKRKEGELFDIRKLIELRNRLNGLKFDKRDSSSKPQKRGDLNENQRGESMENAVPRAKKKSTKHLGANGGKKTESGKGR